MVLERIQVPSDLKNLNREELNTLTGEIREELIQTVSRNGGHLASNLGIVEVTIALHRVFNLPTDKLIFDVGHQSYAHKMLTGRYSRFHTLRTYGGLSGFPKRSESEFDCFETGHASTAISAALGFARARDFQGQKHHVIALVGDGALTGGMCYEALNDAGNSSSRLIVILNDNEMSIAQNVGALSEYLTRLRISAGWQSAKKRVRHVENIPLIGKPLYHVIHSVKRMLKSMLVRDTDMGFFETLGFSYFGPIDGHDMSSLEKTFEMAKKCSDPCVIHVLTRKGYGYNQAEKKPEKFHGTPPFFVENGNRIDLPQRPSCGHIMADTLAEMSRQDDRIIAITAAMKLGTGLDHYAALFPDRVLDVGIAEEHAATMAAGLAAAGMRPYVAIYASFFQRCFDQMIHDVAMQHMPVVFLIDRSGVGGEDGQTHHGVFDLPELLPVPNMRVLAPCDSGELRQMLFWTLSQEEPCAICYQKSGVPVKGVDLPEIRFTYGKWQVLRNGSGPLLMAAGSMVHHVLKAAEILKKEEINAVVVNCSTVKPLDLEFLSGIPKGKDYYTFEENMVTGGFGMLVTQTCKEKGLQEPRLCFGVPDLFLQHGDHNSLMKDAGLTPEQIADRVLQEIARKERHEQQGKS